jgi:hypothetical protein
MEPKNPSLSFRHLINSEVGSNFVSASPISSPISRTFVVGDQSS